VSADDITMKPMNNPYLAAALLSMTAQLAAADRLVDPTRPANAKATVSTTVSAVKVEAIMKSGHSMLAIVNGKVVRAGDVVDGARIDEVTNDGVRYTRAGQASTVRVGRQAIDVRHNVTAGEDQK
jgi:hypothetical protein